MAHLLMAQTDISMMKILTGVGTSELESQMERTMEALHVEKPTGFTTNWSVLKEKSTLTSLMAF